MKTLMKFSAVVAVAMVCGSAAADYLYSMVKDAYYYFNGKSADFDYLKVKGDGNELEFYGVGESDSLGKKIYSDRNDSNSSQGAQDDAGFYVYDPTSSYQTFLFEMFNTGSDERVAWQEFSRNTLLAQGNIYDSTSDHSGYNVLVVSSVVPEPTSGLLSLFGLAALALRRRKRA